jgi:hypothetical protein
MPMASGAFTIHIHVPSGDPEGIRIISRVHWTGKGIVFPREKWPEARQRDELGYVGVYILVGDEDDSDSDVADPRSSANLPTIYIGEGDGIRGRIDDHIANKDFWSWAIAFISRDLNKAHVQWLEYALVSRAQSIGQCHLDNGNTPKECTLTENEKSDTEGFLREIYPILPLVGLRAFEQPKAIAEPRTKSASPNPATSSSFGTDVDTVVVPARIDGFKETFLGENCWYSIRISGGKLPKIKWIAGYQIQPISAITHVAPVERIEPYGDGKKYKLIFSEPARELGDPIRRGETGAGIQGPCYTRFSELIKAKTLSDLFGK